MFIYKVTNLVNGKVYIGQTSGDIKSRWRTHCANSSGCVALSNAIKKYGPENFSIGIIKKCNSKKELNINEEILIALYDCLSPKGYNLKTGGDSGLFTEESKKKMSESHKGHTHSIETKTKMSLSQNGRKDSYSTVLKKRVSQKNMTPVICLNNAIIYFSQNEAARQLGIDSKNINKVLKGKRAHTEGYVFKYIPIVNES